MKISRATAKVLAVLTAFAFIAAACGGSDGTDAAANGDDAATTVPEIPTTAPITATDEVASDDNGGFGTDASDVLGADDATESSDNDHEVTVLMVNDDVQIVPVFDEPNGNNITLRDINAIDGIELEYPLYAETAFGNRLALMVEEYDPSGAWAKVLMPVRPNGTTAWVQTGFFTEQKHDYHITIDVSENKVNVYKGDELLIEQIAVSGRESRATPVVRAYIDEKIRGETLSPAYGDWVLSIAAFSEALGTFDGGMPKLALHGTNQPDLMGQYVSSGCVRIPNEIVSFIADTVPVGTVVDIVA